MKFRKATVDDLELYFNWTNEDEVRKQSFNSARINLDSHTSWFLKKLNSEKCLMLVFENDSNEAIGQVRFEEEDGDGWVIGISVDPAARNKGYAGQMLINATEYFLEQYTGKKIYAYIKKDNIGSVRAFEKAGFVYTSDLMMGEAPSVLYTKMKN